jgi:hypothetical protein
MMHNDSGILSPIHDIWSDVLGGRIVTDEEFRNLVEVRLPSDDDDPCWLFLGSTTKDGRYGRVERSATAHRRAYELSTGEPIPEGYWVGHLCPNLLCVRPAHLICDIPKNVLLANPNWQRGHRRLKEVS